MSFSSRQLPSVDQESAAGARAPDDCDVLVIDDDEDCRELFCALLSAEGYRVQAASSGADALARLARMADSPRLIFLDLVMPGMSGFDCLRILRLTPALASIPVVVHSGRTPSADRGASSGVERWLQKPVRVGVLLEVVRELMR